MECEHSAAVCYYGLKHRTARLKLLAVNEGEKRMRAAERLERFRDVTCNHSLMSGSNQGLRDALEKRCVRTYH